MGLWEGSCRQRSVLVLQHSGLILTENINLTKIKPVIYVFCPSHLHENMQEAYHSYSIPYLPGFRCGIYFIYAFILKLVHIKIKGGKVYR